MTSKHSTRVVAAAASVVAAGLLLAACGGGGSSNKTGGSSASSVVTQTGQGARLSGTFSASAMWAWMPTTMYPSDISEVPSGLYTTGTAIAVSSKYSVSSASCSTLVDYTSGPGFGEEAYIIDQGEDAAKANSYAYGMYEFASAGQASTFVEELAAKFASCGSFTYTNSAGTSAPVIMTDGPRSEAAEVTSGNTTADLRAQLTFKGKTDVADYVLSADGNVVVFATSASVNGAVSTAVDNAKVVEQILTAFTSGEAGGASAGSSAAASYTPCVVNGQTVPAMLQYTNEKFASECASASAATARSLASASAGATPGAGSEIRGYGADAARSALVLASVGGGVS